MEPITLAVHAGSHKDDIHGAINQPIYMTSNYRLPTDGSPIDWSGINSDIYQRNRNVNQTVLQEKLCALTGAEDGVVFGSGVAALMSVFSTFLNTGDHAIVSDVCYKATGLQFRKYLPKKYNIEVTMVDISDTEAVRKAIRPNTKLIHVETPGNPTTCIADLEAVAEIAHANGALMSVDATFAGPLTMHPLQHGADLEIHSMTKYINGHGDTLGGCVLGRKELIDELKELALVNYGGILSPANAWLIARGIATLPLRMKQHCDVAMKVARFLESSPAVRFIYYPGLESHPDHERAVKYMKDGFSAMMCFDINGDAEAHTKFLSALHLVTHAVSLGDIESLIVYNDDSVKEMAYYPEIFKKGFFRFSVGLEDANDLIADLQQAFEKAGIA